MRVIYCAGDQGRVILDILRASGSESSVVFADDDESVHGDWIDGVPVVGELDHFDSGDSPRFYVALGAIGGPRLDLASTIAQRGFCFFNAIHPDSTISSTAALGTGVSVNAQSYLGPGCDVGDHVLVDSCVNVSHDAVLHDGVTITPNAALAGNVTVGKRSYIGPSATIFKDVTLGANVVVGGGAVVTSDVTPDTEVRGIPAEPVTE